MDLKVPASPVPRGCVTKKVLLVLVCRCAKTKRNSTSIRRSGLKEDTGVFRTNVGGPVCIARRKILKCVLIKSAVESVVECVVDLKGDP